MEPLDHSLMVSTLSEAHPETMDFLSNTWCNFAVQSLQPELVRDGSSILLRDNTITTFDHLKLEKNSARMDDADYMKSIPPWKSNDLKSWVWMQQAMHPELNYNAGGFRKKWFQWKMPFGNVSLKKWLKEIKEKRKEEKRLQRAEVHAALSIAGLAAALAAIAEETSKGQLEPDSSPARKVALASAAAVVASQCAQVAETMGAKKDQLSSILGSALSGTSTSDILTLTAAATTSLRGAATLKARAGYKNRLNGVPILPIDVDSSISRDEHDLDFEKSRAILAKGTQLTVETPNGKCVVRIVSIHLNNEAKVILRILKRNLLNVIKSKKECLVLDLHAELYKDADGDEFDTCYQIVLTTTRGPIKIDMADDYSRYNMWATTINQMLMLPPSALTKYEHQFCNY
ncbi:VAN3-binding protein isoform X2 [Amaranthus tricolor]|uniref:VAN3-binding protein isoform X2 n=1 Tax=Amaranthus tricolor TaxID=29722 RepID=UPI002586715D|nr:VAN3-binding protein isoform X2 [Amaranthus tricolor]